VSRASIVLVALGLAACNDVRAFRGNWRGPRVGEATVLKVGVAPTANAELAIDAIDTHGLTGRLSIDGLVSNAPIDSLAGAEADVLAGMTFSGAPLRVYLAFVDVPGTAGEALAVIALYDDRRIEVRVLRGGGSPIYAIFALSGEPT
jgi:hypothetical protein